MERVQSRGAQDHYDRGDLDFYKQLRQGFLDIAQQDGQRCAIIDAGQDIDAIAAQIWDATQERLGA